MGENIKKKPKVLAEVEISTYTSISYQPNNLEEVLS
ncbi:MAG: hypothetical protein PWQ12_1928 [Clostridiales bacterium]|jgi:hypothetical protein|nr:hypothetical protein [Clostridiales bacterium]